ncbi:MAG: AI-2E family transporter, partial [Spirochaetales bacterium]|nr:AI-2E family transporter [Spirochaetales bacterium]
VFISLLFWGWLWGTPGVFLAVPMTTSIKIILENIPVTAPFAILMERVKRRRYSKA